MLITRRLRPLVPALLGAGLILASAAPAAAKMPYFSVELDPAQPAADEPIIVTVRTWADAEHSQPYGFTYEETLTEVVEFQRRGAGEGPALIPVPLRMVEPDLFRAEVTLPAGEWRLVAFPHGRGALESDYGPGYPAPLEVVVRQDAGFAGWIVPVSTGLLAAAVGGALAMRRRRVRAPHQQLAPRPPSAL